MNNQPLISKDRKLAEAKQRMQKLKLKPELISKFAEEGVIPVFYTGIPDGVVALDDNDYKYIEELQKRHKFLIYCVICIDSSYGEMISYLYVSDYEEEWEMDNADLEDGYAMTYTQNVTHPEFSEFGSITILHNSTGGLMRPPISKPIVIGFC